MAVAVAVTCGFVAVVVAVAVTAVRLSSLMCEGHGTVV